MEEPSKQTNTMKSWVGVSMEEIYRGHGPWGFHAKPVVASRNHSVLYHLPATIVSPPKPHYTSQSYCWNNDYVRMPCAPQNLYPVKNEIGQEELRSRWEIIETSLLQSISSSYELEAAIFSYNRRLPKLTALHYFFNEVMDEEESSHFFTSMLPEIIRLALKLPDIVPANIPLLKQGATKSLSMSQLQVSCLLANAFLCTFPWGRDMAETYPGINFVKLYTAHLRPQRINCVSEKLKCICHYFRRVTTKIPVGVITFERKFIPKAQMPRWDNLEKVIGNTKIHVSDVGTIEDNGLGLLQVDFANKYVGGGVLGHGCVQEEIRYVICPELIVTRLFTEQLGPFEALLITGVERFSNYNGYGDSFEWAGNHQDNTPFDESGRKKTNIVAIDASRYSRPADQFNSSAMLRELNKAYVGFYLGNENNSLASAIATGNWGCGAFQGDIHLKSMIQLLACTATKRDMVYYTFGNSEVRDEIYNMYSFLKANVITIKQLWKYLRSFSKACLPLKQLYSFIQQAHFDSKSPKQNNSFSWFNKKTTEIDLPSTSNSTITKNELTNEFDNVHVEKALNNDEYIIDSDVDFIDSSQNDEDLNKKVFKRCKISNSPEESISYKIPKNDDVLCLIDEIGGRERKSDNDNLLQHSLLASLDKLSDALSIKGSDITPKQNGNMLSSNTDETVLDVPENINCVQKPKTKITDYFEVCRNK